MKYSFWDETDRWRIYTDQNGNLWYVELHEVPCETCEGNCCHDCLMLGYTLAEGDEFITHDEYKQIERQRHYLKRRCGWRVPKTIRDYWQVHP